MCERFRMAFIFVLLIGMDFICVAHTTKSHNEMFILYECAMRI